MESFDDPDEQLERIGTLAQDALGAYDLPADASVSLINYSENMTYRVDAPASGDRWALRVHREDYHTRNGIGCELAWMKALREDAGVPTPTRACRGRATACCSTGWPATSPTKAAI
jgi:Ser/Thr protein kinase RdoA (MazF antagonist)